MTTITSATATSHTTSSFPKPHILYNITVKTSDDKSYEVSRRYSEFLKLQSDLVTPFNLPPKRILVTTFVPSAWLDDTLIAERKAGLSAYLHTILQSTAYQNHSGITEFLAPTQSASKFTRLNPEDALPSTLSRKAAAELVEMAGGELMAAAAKPIAAAYYPDWSFDATPPENLDYSKFNLIFFAFATPNSSHTLSWDSGSQAQLKRLVSAAKSSGHGTKIVLSIGGWGGSAYFSKTMSSSSNRTTFVNACVSAVNTYKLDGVDIDWEYPNNPGAGNAYSSKDAANLLSFFKSLRSALGSSKVISAAVTQQPWFGADGNPLTNVSAYADQMTYANIMNYDVWGASSNPGPNAPLNNGCGNSQQPQASAQAAHDQWTAAGFPASKLLLGLPFYGYVSDSKATTLKEIAIPLPNFPITTDAEPAVQCSGNVLLDGEVLGEGDKVPGIHARDKDNKLHIEAGSGDLSSYYGQQIGMNQLISSGALKKQSDGTYGAANGYTYAWDDCSDTPFLYNKSRSTVVTFDDTYSIGDKAALAKSTGMAGCFSWSLDQDDGYTLQNVVRSKLGI